MGRARLVIDESLFVLFLPFSEEITEGIDIVAKARRELSSNSTGFGGDGILVCVHGVSEGYASTSSRARSAA